MRLAADLDADTLARHPWRRFGLPSERAFEVRIGLPDQPHATRRTVVVVLQAAAIHGFV